MFPDDILNCISSIAEVGGTFVEAGVSTTLGQMSKTMRGHFNDLYQNNPDKYVDTLYNELRAITGIGTEDFAFSTKGLSKSSRVTQEGTFGNLFEKATDVLGRVAQAPFGRIETTNRKITISSLATKWSDHFTGREKGGFLSAFFGSNGTTNRVLENSGFGKWLMVFLNLMILIII